MTVQSSKYKKLFIVKSYRRKNNKLNSCNVVIYRDNNKSKTSIENSSPLSQTYRNLNLKLSHYTGGKWFIHGTKHHKEDRLQSLKHSCWFSWHYNDVIMSAMASQILSLTVVYSSVYSGADQRKRQISASLAFVRGFHRWPVDSLHKGPVARKTFPFDDVIIYKVFI